MQGSHDKCQSTTTRRISAHHRIKYIGITFVLASACPSFASVTISAGCEVFTSSIGSEPGVQTACVSTSLDTRFPVEPLSLAKVYSSGANPPVAGVNAGYGVRADYGSLGISLQTAATADIFNSAHEWQFAYASAYANAEFADQILITSPALNPPETTKIVVSGYLDVIISERFSGFAAYRGGLTGLEYNVGVNFQSGTSPNSATFTYFPESSNSSAIAIPKDLPIQEYSFIFEVPVGQPFTLSSSFSGKLFVTAQSLDRRPESTFSNATVAVLALNTAVTYVDLVEQGFFVSTSSGHDYATPVPEPSPTSLAICGVVFIGVVRRLCRDVQKRKSQPWTISKLSQKV